MRCTDLQTILDDFESHRVPDEYRREPTHVHWACARGYLTWFYTVSYPIMTPNVLGGPPRSANQEVFEVWDEKAKSVTTICRRVVKMDRAALESRLFEDDSPQLYLVERMVSELRNIVHFRRRRRPVVRHTK